MSMRDDASRGRRITALLAGMTILALAGCADGGGTGSAGVGTAAAEPAAESASGEAEPAAPAKPWWKFWD